MLIASFTIETDTGLSPIWVIFAITLGGAYFGVLGMFIGVPVVAVVAFLMNKLISARLSGSESPSYNFLHA